MNVSCAYYNLEKIITHGFLSVRIDWRGFSIVLKNITDSEYDQLKLMCGGKSNEYKRLYSLVFCTAYIDHVNILDKRSTDFDSILRIYKKLPINLVEILIDVISDLNKRYSESSMYLEGFVYGDKSRYLWKFLDISRRSKYTGIRGLDNVGSNSVQHNWIIINKSIDEEELYDRDLSLTLITASSFSGKGAESIRKKYDAKKREMEELRAEINSCGYNKKRKEKNLEERDRWTAPIKTKEDLVEELERQMSGEKDKHDLFIEDWIRRQREIANDAKMEVERKKKEFRDSLKDLKVSNREQSKVISKEEIEKRRRRKKSSMPGAGEYMSSSQGNDSKERFLSKVSATVIKPNKNNR